MHALIGATAGSTERHARKVARIAARLRAHDGTRPISLQKRSVSHLVPTRFDRRRTDDKVDVSDLDEILDIDVEGRTCTAEPGVSFARLVRATLAHGLVPTVVPELKSITVGGAISGCSLESMSFARGGFHDSCFEYEVITANGTVLSCTPDGAHRLVFQMMHGSFGTLGILSKVRFALVAAKRYVRVNYHRHARVESYRREIRAHVDARDVDFMDGILHAPDCNVLSVGEFVDEAPYANRYDWMKVYYRSTAERDEDYLLTEQYLFRYDAGVTNPGFKNPLLRLLFGRFAHTAAFLRVANALPFLLPKHQPQVTLDMFIPLSRMEEWLNWHQRHIGFYPLWCVPYRAPHKYEWASDEWWSGIDEPLFVDLAIYGMEQPPGRNVYLEIERALPRVNGMKTLISYNHYDEETFWTIWNRPNYRRVKALTDPENRFRNLYEKTCAAARHA